MYKKWLTKPVQVHPLFFSGSHLHLPDDLIKLIKISQYMRENVQAVESFKHGHEGSYVYGKVGNSLVQLTSVA
jgi:hypothetical protein